MTIIDISHKVQEKSSQCVRIVTHLLRVEMVPGGLFQSFSQDFCKMVLDPLKTINRCSSDIESRVCSLRMAVDLLIQKVYLSGSLNFIKADLEILQSVCKSCNESSPEMKNALTALSNHQPCYLGELQPDEDEWDLLLLQLEEIEEQIFAIESNLHDKDLEDSLVLVEAEIKLHKDKLSKLTEDKSKHLKVVGEAVQQTVQGASDVMKQHHKLLKKRLENLSTSEEMLRTKIKKAEDGLEVVVRAQAEKGWVLRLLSSGEREKKNCIDDINRLNRKLKDQEDSMKEVVSEVSKPFSLENINGVFKAISPQIDLLEKQMIQESERLAALEGQLNRMRNESEERKRLASRRMNELTRLQTRKSQLKQAMDSLITKADSPSSVVQQLKDEIIVGSETVPANIGLKQLSGAMVDHLSTSYRATIETANDLLIRTQHSMVHTENCVSRLLGLLDRGLGTSEFLHKEITGLGDPFLDVAQGLLEMDWDVAAFCEIDWITDVPTTIDELSHADRTRLERLKQKLEKSNKQILAELKSIQHLLKENFQHGRNQRMHHPTHH
eukprot:TRINITY_DN19556_c1_g1_i1.p1 TRINITY_DN19556_c1_g1~~TRINITY_DN19556_c1_g1_i1.p1  ORF type:complete len:586 (-),score=120.22 TRINITY_DN19556_c1_g1_i1:39-1697(-)